MKLAIVIPWFGLELKGGAEQQAWQIATRLAQRGHDLEVMTTCCRSHQDDWSTNHLPPRVIKRAGRIYGKTIRSGSARRRLSSSECPSLVPKLRKFSDQLFFGEQDYAVITRK